MKRVLLAGLLSFAFVLVACGGGDAGTKGTVEGANVVVEMYDNRFQFTEVRIPVGGSVKWLGAGRNPHNSFAADGSWSTESVFGSKDQLDGDEAVLTYNTPGEFIFYCTYHGNAEGDGMAGTLIVEEGA